MGIAIRSGSIVDRRLKDRTTTAPPERVRLEVLRSSKPTVYYRVGNLITTRESVYLERLDSQSR